MIDNLKLIMPMERSFAQQVRMRTRPFHIWLLLLLAIGSVCSTQAEGQPRTDVTFHDERIEKVLEYISRKLGYEFIFNSDVFDKDRRVTVALKNVTVGQLLDRLLGEKYTYTIVDNYVVISLRLSVLPPPPVAGADAVLKGRVLSDDDQGLAGASVMVAGTTAGTVTDIDGYFSLDVPDGARTIVISFIGYKTREIAYSSTQTTLDVTLETDVTSIHEVVVTAYGEQDERAVVGAISSVSGRDLQYVPTANIANLLQGRAAGVNVMNASGSPGGGGISISIRGFNSLSVESARRTSEPLWVIDGVPMQSFTSPITGTNSLAEINPDDIESLQILKDASAASIYGSRAANGVILVTTKKGRSGKTSISANVSQTYTLMPQLPYVMAGNKERQFRIEALKNYRQGYSDAANKTFKLPASYEESYANAADYDYFWNRGSGNSSSVLQDSLNSFYNNATNWFDYYFAVGKVTNASFQLNGGSPAVRYNVGLGAYTEDGVVVSTGFNRANLLTNIDITPNDRFHLALRLTANRTDRSRGVNATEGFLDAAQIESVPTAPLLMSTLYPGKGTAVYDETLKKLEDLDEKIIGYRYRTNLVMSYEVLKNLELKTSLSLDQLQQSRNFFRPSYLLDADGRKESISEGEVGRNLSVLNENLLMYSFSLNNSHAFDLLLGQSVQVDDFEYMGGSARNGPSDLIKYARWNFPTLRTDNNGVVSALQTFYTDFTRSALVSYFGRVNYNYNMKYLLSYTLRRDGSSRFGEDVRYATFPSYAVGWAFTEEKFMDGIKFINHGKIRASYGISGMQFSQPYLAYGLLTTSPPFLGYSTVQPVYSNGLFNPGLTWEETDQFDLGLNLDMFNDKLGIVFDYYYRYTDKMLYEVRLPGIHSGYDNQWRNAYAVSNEGVELQVKTVVVNNTHFQWSLTFNAARNWNLLRKSYSGNDWKFFTGQDTDRYLHNRNIVGKPLNGIVVLKTNGIYQSAEAIPYTYNATGVKVPFHGNSVASLYAPGDLVFYDATGDGSIQTLQNDDRVYVGSPLPQAHGGIVNEIRWHNFDVNVLLSYVLHRTVLNLGGMNSLTTTAVSASHAQPILMDLRTVTFWEKPGDVADYPKNQIENGRHNFTGAIEENVENVSYIKLKTFTLGYQLPKKLASRIRLGGARLFASGENLFTITNYSGLDPEAVDIVTGVDAATNYPLPKRVTLGLTLNL